ncbi:hypothetical protein L3Y34_010566 [Caenorhabditis briggsae]|uniref:Uncharacterized protein n=1 Tax=Caenorhabditis briggsae TaxID=6238 RepID=A0AAE8ZLU0_CAEBR|nr:hypothetical protein L3Y34_010566 [Caenorhabditis briggsae]
MKKKKKAPPGKPVRKPETIQDKGPKKHDFNLPYLASDIDSDYENFLSADEEYEEERPVLKRSESSESVFANIYKTDNLFDKVSGFYRQKVNPVVHPTAQIKRMKPTTATRFDGSEGQGFVWKQCPSSSSSSTWMSMVLQARHLTFILHALLFLLNRVLVDQCSMMCQVNNGNLPEAPRPSIPEAPRPSIPEAPRPSIPEGRDQNADPMEQDEEDNKNLPGPGPATLEMRNLNLQLDVPMEED